MEAKLILMDRSSKLYFVVGATIVVLWLIVSVAILGLFGMWADTATKPNSHDAIVVAGIFTTLSFGFAVIMLLDYIRLTNTAVMIRLLIALCFIAILFNSIF